MLVKKSFLVSSQIVIVRETSLVSTFRSQKQHFSHRNRPFESSFPSRFLCCPRVAAGPSAAHSLLPSPLDWSVSTGTRFDPRHFLRPCSTCTPCGPLFSPVSSPARGQLITHHSLTICGDRIRYFFTLCCIEV